MITKGIVKVFVFIFNAVTLTYYYKMAHFFIDLMENNAKHKRNFKIMMWLFIVVIMISNAVENLLYAIVPILFTFKLLILSDQQLSNYFVALRVFDLFR